MAAQVVSSAVALSHKPGASIEYNLVPARPSRENASLLVFLNGLMLDQTGWLEVISHLQRKQETLPTLLSYDRYGQGRTVARDPQDDGKEPGHGHDFMDVVHDLHQLIRQLSSRPAPQALPHLMFVSNSIGCAIARLFTQTYPGTVEGIIMLDSNIATSDLVSIFPDPEAPHFDASGLPEGVTPDALHHIRMKFTEIFHPNVTNREGLSRRNVSDLLPSANSPVLQGVGGKCPLLTVVGHDPVYFAEESKNGSIQAPLAITMNYMNPTWHQYNEGLVEIAGDRGQGPIIAKNCGHFIQRDDPEFVADLVCDMLDKLRTE